MTTTRPGKPDSPSPQRRNRLMDFLLFLGIIGGWILLQAWILPKLGVPT